MTSHSPAVGSEQQERDLAFATVRNAVFDSVLQLLDRRKSKDGVTQAQIARRLNCDPAWVSRTLSGPANWTLQTWSDFVFALDGYVQLEVPPREEVVPANYDIYADLFDLPSQAAGHAESSAALGNTAMFFQTQLFASGTSDALKMRAR